MRYSCRRPSSWPKPKKVDPTQPSGASYWRRDDLARSRHEAALARLKFPCDLFAPEQRELEQPRRRKGSPHPGRSRSRLLLGGEPMQCLRATPQAEALCTASSDREELDSGSPRGHRPRYARSYRRSPQGHRPLRTLSSSSPRSSRASPWICRTSSGLARWTRTMLPYP